jgi:hypothetical protein
MVGVEVGFLVTHTQLVLLLVINLCAAVIDRSFYCPYQKVQKRSKD